MDTIKNVLNIVRNYVPTVIITYISWTLVHYIASHLYVHLCTGFTFISLIVSPIYSSAPHCKALSWIIYNVSNNFEVMWITIGTYLMGLFLLKRND